MKPSNHTQRRFSATACAGPGDMPTPFWRKIGLRYPGGHEVSLAYTAEPADPAELPQLMWQLQRAAGAYGLQITVTDADGITTQAPPIGAAQ